MILKWMKNLIRQIPFVGQYLYNLLNSLKWQSLLKSGVVFLFAGYLVFYINLKQQNCIYQYTHLPDELTRKGFTESFAVRQIQRIKSFIVNYRPEFRKDQDVLKARSSNKNHVLIEQKYDAFTSDQMQTIEHLKIGSISIEALIVLTDKLVSFFGIDSDNYMALEYSLIAPNTLQLNASLGRNHSIFTENVQNDNLHDALSSLNIRAAKMILEKKDPTALIEYYYNSANERACAAACRRTLQDFTDKGVQADALGYLAMVSDDSVDYRWYLQQASRLNSDWQELVVLNNARFGVGSWNELDSLVKLHPESSTYHQARLDYYLFNAAFGETDNLNRCIASIKKSVREYPSTVHYYYASLMASWGSLGSGEWLDSAIVEYRRAINWEQRETKEHTPNAGLLANYYNELAYAFEQKILLKVGNCNSFIEAEQFRQLDSCHHHVMQAILYNQDNPWAWSTMAEYYGLTYMNTKKKDDSVKFYYSLSKAVKLGFDPSYQWQTPPYCLLDFDKRGQVLAYQRFQVARDSVNELILMELLPPTEEE